MDRYNMTLTQNTLDEDFVEAIKDRINSKWSYMGVGDGTTPSSSVDTSLDNEVHRNIRQQTSTTADSRTVSMWLDSTQANTETISELGVFDTGSIDTGSIWVRHLLDTPLNKTSAIEMWFDVTVTVSVTEDTS
jgi:hypothetical protein